MTHGVLQHNLEGNLIYQCFVPKEWKELLSIGNYRKLHHGAPDYDVLFSVFVQYVYICFWLLL